MSQRLCTLISRAGGCGLACLTLLSCFAQRWAGAQEQWTVNNLHPAGFEHSYAYATRAGWQVGEVGYGMWGLAGWNIYTHHNHLDVTPPALEPEKPYWGWHQDGYRQNSDPETLDTGVPRPMFSLKVAYVLSDLSQTGRGASKGG